MVKIVSSATPPAAPLDSNGASEAPKQNPRSHRFISKERFDDLSSELVEIRKMLNSYINSIGLRSTQNSDAQLTSPGSQKFDLRRLQAPAE